MISRFIALLGLVLLPFFTNAQCSASFTYQVNGMTVTFDGSVSQPPTPQTTYYWWFSDNSSSSTLQDPTHTFSTPGMYMVCFSVWDPITQCSDSLCQYISVGIPVCNADFTAIDSMGVTFFISTSTVGASGYYFWDFGDGNYSTSMNPTNTYVTGGTYLVCLTVLDSNQNFCDSVCHSVTVQGNGGGCHADWVAIDSMGYVFFISNSTLGAGANYAWNFGDGGYSTQMNPSYQYALPGNYTVCLFVFDSLQNFCDSACHTITVNQVGVAEQNFLQSLNAAPNPADEFMIFSFNAINSGVGTITFFDATGRLVSEKSVSHTSGNNKTEINTSTLPQGNYLVKIVVNGNEGWTRIAITHQ